MATYTSEVEIGNEALILVGEERIQSFDDPGKAARTLKREYPKARDQLLESYDWKFSIEKASLSPDDAAPLFGYSSKFLLPADCLRFRGLYDGVTGSGFVGSNDPLVNYSGTDIPHKVEGRFLLLNNTEALIWYIKRVTNPLEFAPMFGEALATRLAHRMCYDLTSSITRTNQLKSDLGDIMRRARLMQAIQGTTEIVVVSELTDAHSGFYGSWWPGQRGWVG